MVFDPREPSATIVCTSSGQGVTNPDYTSELEAYLKHEHIAAIMRERTSVCGRG